MKFKYIFLMLGIISIGINLYIYHNKKINELKLEIMNIHYTHSINNICNEYHQFLISLYSNISKNYNSLNLAYSITNLNNELTLYCKIDFPVYKKIQRLPNIYQLFDEI